MSASAVVRPLLAALVLLVAACGDNLDVVPGQPDSTPPSTVCSNGVDDDNDGSIDYPADPGCDSPTDADESNPPIAQCMDGRDNDGDGKTDFPEDPGCFVQLQNSELDDCPDGPNCPQCSNGMDDDGDGMTDYPADDGCLAASGQDEFGTDPNACGPGLTVTRLDTPTVTGTLSGTSHLTSDVCGGGGGEVPYELIITEPSVIVATTDFPETTVDTSLYLRTDCLTPATELVCNDNSSATTLNSSITVSVAAGRYYLIVDARTIGETGNFKLGYSLYAGEGTPCVDQSECGPGLQCRIPMGETEQICTTPVCSDAVDDDGDGFNDYPDDPGCDTPADFDEIDDCPSGPDCPACSNDLDDDADGLIDFGPGGDPDCMYAAQPAEGCNNETDMIQVMNTASATGSTSGLTNDFEPTCAFGGSGPDAVHLVSLPAMQSFHVDDAGSSYQTVLALQDSTCSDELACDNNFSFGGDFIDSGPLDAGAYAIVIDGYAGSSGAYQLNIGGTIAPHGDCTGPLATAGIISCGAGYSCLGGQCLGTLECNNGTDDDGDGKADYPDDPGCVDSNDTTEIDDCPSGPTCPACANGIDDDGDGAIDYPADPECNAASQAAESCPTEHDPFLTLTGPTESGNLVGSSNDFPLVCGGAGGADRVYLTTIPDVDSITFDTCTSSFDTVLAMYNLDCATSLTCDDDSSCGLQSQITLTDLSAGTYALVVAAYSTGGGGPYVLHTTGTISAGGRCDGALATSGALTCAPGYACDGTVCAPSECNNGVDDDGDGFLGYPDDPGCVNINDNDESDNCPSGPGCASCSNNLDDDGNGVADYPDDPSCVAAGGTEGTCGFDSDGVSQVVIPLYSGSTGGLTNDFTPFCASFGSPVGDRAFAIDLPQPVAQLHVDTAGSSFETVLSVTDATCTSTLDCDFESAGFGNSVVDLFGLAAGSYGIIVDGYTSTGSYLLSIRATVPSGAACTDPLFSTGVMVCPANHICTGGTCQPLP